MTTPAAPASGPWLRGVAITTTRPRTCSVCLLAIPVGTLVIVDPVRNWIGHVGCGTLARRANPQDRRRP